MKNKAAIPGASSRGMVAAATLLVVAGAVALVFYHEHSVRGERGQLVAVAEAMVPPGSDTTESVILRANDVGELSATGTVSAMRNVPIDRYFSWLEGVVQFENEPLGDAARVIERQYGLGIRITDSALARRRFTGSIRGASLHADLRGLALLLDARYEREGNRVILWPLTAGPQHTPPNRRNP